MTSIGRGTPGPQPLPTQSTTACSERVDLSIPRYSHDTTLEPFPELRYVNYVAHAAPAPDNMRQQLSLQLPFKLSSDKSMIRNGSIDLRYDLVKHDPLSGQVHYVVGRPHYPSRARVGFCDTVSYSDSRIIIAPVAAALASEVVDKNVASAITAIKALFPMVNANEFVSLAGRATIRQLAGSTFCVDRFVWRLATIYVSALWVAANNETLTSGQTAYAPFTWVNTITTYSGILEGWQHGNNPVCVQYSGYADLIAPLLAVIKLACCNDPQYRTTNNFSLPSIAHNWPAISNVHTYYSGPQLLGTPILGDILPSTVWEAAELWCGQHGVMQLFTDMVQTVAVLWCSTSSSLSPIYQADRLGIAMPVADHGSTILLPIGQSYVTWRDEFKSCPSPVAHELFVGGCVTGVLIGLGVRTWAYKTGIPYANLVHHSTCDVNLAYEEFKLRGGYVGAMVQAQAQLRNVGCTGTLGRILLQLQPAFTGIADCVAWWGRSNVAYQWEEVANLVSSIPMCCALAGVVKPLRSRNPIPVGPWCYVRSIAPGYTVEQALHGVSYVEGMRLGLYVKDAISCSSRVLPVYSVMNYRQVPTDWQFIERFSRDYCSVEMVFKSTMPSSSVKLHEGPVGSIGWKWYVSRKLLANNPLVWNVLDDDMPDTGCLTTVDHGSSPMTEHQVIQPPHGTDATKVATEPGMKVKVSSKTYDPSVEHQFDVAIRLMRDAGLSTDWLENCRKGYTRLEQGVSPWVARSEEGWMRAAYDGFEAMDPMEALLAIPNGQRPAAATALASIYRVAAAVAHSPTAAKNWIMEGIRMSNRAGALKKCSAMTKVELEDYSSRQLVAKKKHVISNMSLARALAMGLSAMDVLDGEINYGGLHPDSELLSPVTEAANTAMDEVEAMVKISYDSDEIDAAMVTDILGYTPAWAEPKISSDLGDAGVPTGDAASSVIAAEVDAFVVDKANCSVSATATDCKNVDSKQDFGAASSSDSCMQQPTLAATTGPPSHGSSAQEDGPSAASHKCLGVDFIP